MGCEEITRPSRQTTTECTPGTTFMNDCNTCRCYGTNQPDKICVN